MTYRGYSAAVQFDEDAGIFYGEVLNIRDVVTFAGKSVSELQRAFKDSVEDYLEFCGKLGQEPEKPFSGKLAIRISPVLHRKVAIAAKISGKSMNTVISEALRSSLD